MVKPITTALVASAVIGGAINTVGGIQQSAALRARGKAIEEFYNNQAKINRIQAGRTARKAAGTAVAQAGASGVLFSGSRLDSAMSDLFDFDLQQTARRQSLKAQGVLSRGGQDFSASNALGGAAAAPIQTAGTIFSALDNNFPKGSTDKPAAATGEASLK